MSKTDRVELNPDESRSTDSGQLIFSDNITPVGRACNLILVLVGSKRRRRVVASPSNDNWRTMGKAMTHEEAEKIADNS